MTLMQKLILSTIYWLDWDEMVFNGTSTFVGYFDPEFVLHSRFNTFSTWKRRVSLLIYIKLKTTSMKKGQIEFCIREKYDSKNSCNF